MSHTALRITFVLLAMLALPASAVFADPPASRLPLERIDASVVQTELASSEGLVFLDVYADW